MNSKQALSLPAAAFLMACAALAQQNPPMHHMQHGREHVRARDVKFEQKLDAASRTITLRLGPMNLPAKTGHSQAAQPADQLWAIPVDGWLVAYHPKLVDAEGREVPGRLLHHTAFWNVNRSDFLCRNKEEHIFGAGGEMNDWPELPGFGYRVRKGDRIRIETMVHNPTEASYPQVWLEVRVEYREAPKDGRKAAIKAAIKNVYPAWMDARECNDSGYDLQPGANSTTGTITVMYNGTLLGVGGHMHDYGRRLVLENMARKETVAMLDAALDSQGRILSMPVVTFFDKGGYRLAKGDTLRITATYDNPTGKMLADGAMGIVVGYFVPESDVQLSALRRFRKPMAKNLEN